MHTNLQDRSIKTILTIAIAVVSISFTLFITIILYHEFSNTIKENATVSTREIVRQVNANLSYYINDIVTVAGYARELAKQTDQYSTKEIEGKLKAILASRQDIVSLILFDMEGNRLFGTSQTPIRESQKIVAQQWFTRAIGGEGNFYFTGPHVQQLFPSQYPWVITYSQQISYTKPGGELEQGLLLIDMNFSAVSELCQSAKLGTTGYVYFIDNNGKIVYHPLQQLINSNIFKEDLDAVNDHIFGTFTSTFDGRERLTIIDTVNNCRWRIVGVAFMDELMRGLNQFTTLMILLVLVCIIITIFLARLVSSWISRPIRQLEKLMISVENGDLSVPPPVKGNKEVAALSLSFAKMIQRIRQLMDDIVKSQEMKRKFELDALQAKINPHFLYNTLDSVVWMAEQGDTEGVIKMITSLAKLFRISISKGHDIITLEEELEHVRNYLIIQQTRYRGKFEFSIDLPADMLDLPTIKLIVQPIVENAIYHGIKYLQELGHIDIKVFRRKPGAIVIEVKDNGVGMDENTLLHILKCSANHLPDGSGIGVKNVHQRVQLYYGSDFGLEISSELDEGTLVNIIIPENSPIHTIKVEKK
ncbi:sensor histidine kinase [uncultured Sphaerochaeta sp.]|uniref:cache domain-containing sensor histidine kinase n=1 Tax=uncultured Sphaerochaeta sp. TaxID=886478 RepID=UPI002A0A0F6A|nr:sensor histidine kinase [uncultured Sphaerochaeta sp.]